MINSPYFPLAFALLLAIPFLIYIRQFVFSYIKLKNNEIKLLTVKGNIKQCVRAYERLNVFLERLKPSNLVAKFDSKLAPQEYISLVEKAPTKSSITMVHSCCTSPSTCGRTSLAPRITSFVCFSPPTILGECATLDE